MKVIVALMLSVSLTTLVAPAAQAAADCEFQLGFATLAKLIPDRVGGCADTVAYNVGSGDALQHTTTGGLLVWRKADNWTAFTDGYHTWVNGPQGLQERLNSGRFSWEAPTPTSGAPAPASEVPPHTGSSPDASVTEADVAVPDGYPPMSELPPDQRAGCLHLAQDLKKASSGTEVHMQTDDQSCPYFAAPDWPGFIS